MIIAGLIVAVIAALIHVFIFYLESMAWTAPKTRATFGTTEQVARDTKALAFNQGFYNLFLAIEVGLGAGVALAANRPIGLALVFAGTGSMVAAGLVLMLSDRTKTSAALKQLVPPLVAIGLLVLGLAL